jgi:hypothetical protein
MQDRGPRPAQPTSDRGPQPTVRGCCLGPPSEDRHDGNQGMLVHFQKTIITRALGRRANARRPRRITKVDRDRIGRRRLLFLTRQPTWKAPLLD